MKDKICAIIELSPMGVKCRIAQKNENNFNILDSIESYMEISPDPSFEEMEKLCKILNDLKNNLNTYDLKKQNITLYAVSSIGESKNRSFMQDIIKTKTGFNLIFLDLKQKNNFMFKRIMSRICDFNIMNEPTLIAGIDYGHISLILIKDRNIIFTENFSLGTLKIREIIRSINYNPLKADIIIEEYFYSYIKVLKTQLPVKSIKNLVIRGTLFELINKELLSQRKNCLPFAKREEFFEHIKDLKSQSDESLAYQYNILENRAELILPKLTFAKLLMDLTGVQRIYSLSLSLMDAMIYRKLFAREALKYNKYINDSIISSSKEIAKKYLYDSEHAETVKFIAFKIFHLFKKEHNFNNKDLILLEAACYLHDIGKFLSLKDHYKHSYQLIRGTTIFGLSDDEIEIVAILSFYHSRKTPTFKSKMFKNFTEPERMKIIKLIAILRMADSLDRSHQQKISDLSLKIDEHVLTLLVKCNEKLIIENWAFEKKSELFQNIFGFKTQIRLKN